LNVWGSWCPGCRVEHPVITRFAETRRVRVVGYNWKDEHADALRWLEQFGNPYWLVLVDYDGRKAIDWGIYGAPETFLVDAEGIVRWKHVGPVDDTVIAESLVPMLDSLGVAPGPPRGCSALACQPCGCWRRCRWRPAAPRAGPCATPRRCRSRTPPGA